MKKHLLFILFGFIFLTGCRLDEPVIPDNLSTLNPVDQNSYQPLTKGTYHAYKVVLDSHDAGEMTDRMTGDQPVFNGKTYATSEASYTFLFPDEKPVSHLRNVNGSYYSYSDVYFDDDLAEVEYLRENASQGESWINSISIAQTPGFSYRFKVTLLEKNITKVVLSKTYKSVMHTKVELQEDSGDGSGFKTTIADEYYIAKGIGYIETIEDNGFFKTVCQIKSYGINK